MTAGPPGLLRRDQDPDVVLMLCTAGHVDHGKTSLVHMLTGCRTDRLKEEQERGMTIELGFAPCYLGDDLCVGIVDVPGHEKFVRTMVAGVSGIGLALLVIAADDGVMPQTVEHVQIMELLGLRQGVVALNKCDLVDAATLRQREQEIRDFLQGTFLRDAPILAVSATTGAGVAELHASLVAHARHTQGGQRAGLFRMPVERAFSRPGMGCVVTGIPTSGQVAVGDTLELAPDGGQARVRGMQRFLRDAAAGGAGQCLALNLPDFNKDLPARGQVLATPGCLRAVSMIHARLHTVGGQGRPLANAEGITFHSGTAEAAGKVYLVESKDLAPGASGLVTLLLQAPVAVAPGDRFIVRRASPAATVGGGTVGLAVAETRRPRREALLAAWQIYEKHLAGAVPGTPDWPRQLMLHALATDPAAALSLDDLARAGWVPPRMAADLATQLKDQGLVRELEPGCFFLTAREAACLGEARQAIAATARASGGLHADWAALRSARPWPAALWAHLLDRLATAGEITRQGVHIIPRAATSLSAAQQDLVARILALYAQRGFQSPRPDEVPGLLGAAPEKVLPLIDLLCKEQRLIRLNPHVVLDRDHAVQAQDLVIRQLREKGTLDSADFKHAIQSSRKYALAILDWLDQRRVTLRAGNLRRLAPQFEKGLLQA